MFKFTMETNRKGEIREVYTISEFLLEDILKNIENVQRSSDSKDTIYKKTKQEIEQRILKDFLSKLIDNEFKWNDICPFYKLVELDKDFSEQDLRNLNTTIGPEKLISFLENLKYQINDYSLGHFISESPKNFLKFEQEINSKGYDINHFSNMKIRGPGIYLELLDPNRDKTFVNDSDDIAKSVKNLLLIYGMLYFQNKPNKSENTLETVLNLKSTLDYLVTDQGFNNMIIIEAKYMPKYKIDLERLYSNLNKEQTQYFEVIDFGVGTYCNGAGITSRKKLISIKNPKLLLKHLEEITNELDPQVNNSLVQTRNKRKIDMAKLRKEDYENSQTYQQRTQQEDFNEIPQPNLNGIKNTIAYNFMSLSKQQKGEIYKLLTNKLKDYAKDNCINYHLYTEEYSRMCSFTLKLCGTLVTIYNFLSKTNHSSVRNKDYKLFFKEQIKDYAPVFFGDFTPLKFGNSSIMNCALEELKKRDTTTNLKQVQRDYILLHPPVQHYTQIQEQSKETNVEDLKSSLAEFEILRQTI